MGLKPLGYSPVMPKLEVTLKFGREIPVSYADVEIPVRIDGKPTGRLRVSQGSVDWMPAWNKKRGYRMTWTELAEMMKQQGHEFG